MTAGVLVVGTHLDRVEANVFAGVARAGFSVTAMAEETSPYQDLLTAAGVRFRPLSCKGRVDPKAIHTIRAEIQSGSYQILHGLSNRSISNALLAALRTSIKRVAYRGTVGHISFFDPLAWLTYLSPTLDRIVCVSDAVNRYLQTKVSPTKLVTIRKGHEIDWYQRATKRELEQFGIPADAFVVTCVANMRPVKGVPFLLDAIDMMPAELNVHLLLIGTIDSTAAKAITKDRHHPERIHAIGFQAAPHVLVSQSDCFVMPSIEREGLPKALLEAMSVGVPAIGTDVGGIPEVIRHGENGLVVPPKNAAAIAEAIGYLAHNPPVRQQFAGSAEETIRDRLSCNRSIQNTITLYEELVKSS